MCTVLKIPYDFMVQIIASISLSRKMKTLGSCSYYNFFTFYVHSHKINIFQNKNFQDYILHLSLMFYQMKNSCIDQNIIVKAHFTFLKLSDAHSICSSLFCVFPSICRTKFIKFFIKQDINLFWLKKEHWLNLSISRFS